jgi:hypothetical protein
MKTCIATAIDEKVMKLDVIDRSLISVSLRIPMPLFWIQYCYQDIQGLVSVIYDGWSSKQRRPFSSYSIQFVNSPLDDPYKWSLASHLIAFKHTIGRHSGIMIGNEMATIIDEFGFRKKVYPFILSGDNVCLLYAQIVGGDNWG